MLTTKGVKISKDVFKFLFKPISKKSKKLMLVKNLFEMQIFKVYRSLRNEKLERGMSG